MKILKLVIVAVLFTGCPADSAVDNTPPQITIDSELQIKHTVGDGVIRITAAVSDPDGDDVSISIAEKPDRATFQDTGKLAVFTWDPLVSDVTPSESDPRKIVFIATDSRGAIVEKTVRAEILPGNGVPRFLQPSPIVLHRIDREDSVQFTVEVRDDDASQVEITMPEFPPGANFAQNESFSGLFRWPVPEEAKDRRIHQVSFIVNDGQSPPVEHKVSITLEKGDRTPVVKPNPLDPTGCIAEDTIQHIPLKKQTHSEDYEISVVVAEPYDQVTMYWSDQDVWNDLSIEMENVGLEKNGTTYTTTIANPLLASGSAKTYYYYFCAVDQEAEGDEGVFCGPTQLFYSFTAYGPDSTNCVEESDFPSDTFEAAIYRDFENSGTFSLHQTCAGSPDYYEVSVGRNQILTWYVLGNNIEVERYDENRNVQPNDGRLCPGFYLSEITNTSPEPMTVFFRVTGDNSPYQVIPFFEDLDTCTREGEPNEMVANSTILTAGSTAAQICPMGDKDLYRIDVESGKVLTVDALFSHEIGDIDIELWKPSQIALVGDDVSSVAWSLSTNDNEQLIYTASESGMHYLQVATDDQKSNDYTLNVEISEVQCTDGDGFAGNTTRMTAPTISVASYPDLELCPMQSDWFSIPVLEDDLITFEVSRSDGGDIASMSMDLYRGTSFVDFGTTSGDTVSFQRLFSQDESFFLEVSSDEPAEYTLSVTQEF